MAALCRILLGCLQLQEIQSRNGVCQVTILPAVHCLLGVFWLWAGKEETLLASGKGMVLENTPQNFEERMNSNL